MTALVVQADIGDYHASSVSLPSDEAWLGLVNIAVFRSRWSSGDTLASDASGPLVQLARGTLVHDSSIHSVWVGKWSTAFMLGINVFIQPRGDEGWRAMCSDAGGAVLSRNCIRHSAHGLSIIEKQSRSNCVTMTPLYKWSCFNFNCHSYQSGWTCVFMCRTHCLEQTACIYSYRQWHKVFQTQLKNSSLYRCF